jgi:hypothetical protein
MQVITRHVVTAEPQRRRSLSDSAGEVCLTAREKYLRQRGRSLSDSAGEVSQTAQEKFVQNKLREGGKVPKGEGV